MFFAPSATPFTVGRCEEQKRDLERRPGWPALSSQAMIFSGLFSAGKNTPAATVAGSIPARLLRQPTDRSRPDGAQEAKNASTSARSRVRGNGGRLSRNVRP